MINISFHKNAAGTLVGTWPGTTEYIDGKPRKTGQIYLGKVINKERLIFWNRNDGYFSFSTVTLSKKTLEPGEISFVTSDEPDGARKQRPVLVDFGDSYFLNCFLSGIGYDRVIDTLTVKNRDTLYALLHYYILEDRANSHAETWYRHNYASLLYPGANIYSQRISELLAVIGTPEQKRNFLIAHIEYVLASTDKDVSVLIDSTGLPNKSNLPITRYSNHEGEVNIEFRMIALVQHSTGLPLFYEIIPGNVVDVSTTLRIVRMAAQYNCNVSYAIGDAGYACPSMMERLILSGIDFMTRLNPTYENFKEILANHVKELDDPAKIVRFKNRLVSVVKIKMIIAKDNGTGADVSGYAYLCKDLQSAASKKDHLMSSKQARQLTTQEIITLCERFGIFAIATTRDLPNEQVLPEYYIRQGVEQYFDYGKNYAKFLPVRQHQEQTLAGHMLLAFIATFVVILIKNRLNVLDTRYTQIPVTLSKELPENGNGNEEVTTYEDQEEKKYFIKQDPIASVFKESPATLFFELRCQKADVFQTVIIPEIPVRQAKDFYEAFKLNSPDVVQRKETGLVCEFDNGAQNKLTRKLAFAVKPVVTDEKIEERRNKSRIQESAQDPADANTQENNKQSSDDLSKTKSRGRPKGSKNKATLLKEAEAAKAGTTKQSKRGKGRPKGSKNKKTLAREAAEANKPVKKKKRGRPIGSKNKPKTGAMEGASQHATPDTHRSGVEDPKNNIEK